MFADPFTGDVKLPITPEVDDRILDKIRKLMSVEGRTEEEAQLFAEKAQELLAKYKLSMTDIQFEDFKVHEPIEKHLVNWKEHQLKVKRQRIQWVEDLAYFVADAYQCRFLVHQGTNYITFIGRRNDAKVAEFTLVTLVRMAEKIADKAYVKFFYECRDRGEVHLARGFRASFLKGFVLRIGRRLQEKRDEFGKGSTALVRLSVRDVDDWMKQALPKVKEAAALSRTRLHGEGYDRGVKAANKIDLDGKAVEGEARRSFPK